MGILVQLRTHRPGAGSRHGPDFAGEAAVLLFTGVRYEREQLRNAPAKPDRVAPFSRIIANSNHKSK